MPTIYISRCPSATNSHHSLILFTIYYPHLTSEQRSKASSQTSANLITRLRFLRHGSKHGIMSGNAWAMFIVIGFRVTNTVEFWSGSQHTAAKPNRIPLHGMGDDLNIYWFRLDCTLTQILAQFQSGIDDALHVAFQSTAKIAEHCRSPGEHDVLIQTPSDVDWTVLNRDIHSLRDRCREIRI